METNDHDTFVRAYMTPEEFKELMFEIADEIDREVLEARHLPTSAEEDVDGTS